ETVGEENGPLSGILKSGKATVQMPYPVGLGGLKAANRVRHLPVRAPPDVHREPDLGPLKCTRDGHRTPPRPDSNSIDGTTLPARIARFFLGCQLGWLDSGKLTGPEGAYTKTLAGKASQL